MRTKLSVIMADGHSPYEDKSLWKAIRKYIKDLNLSSRDEVVYAGDMLDNHAVSPFDKNSNRKKCVQDERQQFIKFMNDNCKASGKAKSVFVIGNHEQRWNKELEQGDFKDLINVPELVFSKFFGLSKHKMEVVESYKPNKDFLVKHGNSCAENPAKVELMNELISGCSGHAHRTFRYYKTGHKLDLKWFSLGHLADKDKIDKECKFSKPLKWRQSFGLLITDHKNNTWDFEVMHVNKNGFYSKYLRKFYKV